MFDRIKATTRKTPVLGWQYEMIYLDGDPHNLEEAIVTVRVLERAIVIRAQDMKEETFQSVMIPYPCVRDLKIVDEQKDVVVGLREKRKFNTVYSVVLLTYLDGDIENTVRLRMAATADIYQNSRLCCNMQDYVRKKKKNDKEQ